MYFKILIKFSIIDIEGDFVYDVVIVGAGP